MDTTTEIKHIDHLGLVAAACDEAGIVDLINEFIALYLTPLLCRI